MDILILIAGIILLFIGLAGSVLPVIPGPPLSFIALFLLKFTHYVEPGEIEAFNRLLWIYFAVTIIVTILDYIVPIWGTKKFGGSRSGTIGATIGLIVGLFFGPPGIILGPVIGAVVAELASGRDQKASLRSGFGSFIGVITGGVVKLVVSALITDEFIIVLV
jgi:uncharacterized protein YqgC (DUF456 family)